MALVEVVALATSLGDGFRCSEGRRAAPFRVFVDGSGRWGRRAFGWLGLSGQVARGSYSVGGPALVLRAAARVVFDHMGQLDRGVVRGA